MGNGKWQSPAVGNRKLMSRELLSPDKLCPGDTRSLRNVKFNLLFPVGSLCGHPRALAAVPPFLGTKHIRNTFSELAM